MSSDFRWYGPDDRSDRGDLYRRDYGADYRRSDDTRRGESRSWREEQRAREDERHDAWRPFGDTGPTNYGARGDRSGYRSGQFDRGERSGEDYRRGGLGGGEGRGFDREARTGYERDRDGGFTETGGRYSESFARDQDDYRGPRDNDRQGEGGQGRNWLDKAGDEIQSFFTGGRRGEHRGKGPKGYRRSDTRISEDVSDRLTEDAWLDASEVEVKVDDGEVTLSGHVSSREDKRRAEDLAERVSGVSHVQNNVRVRKDGTGMYAEEEPPRV